MIVTLTPNTGIDHTVRVAHFELDRTIRAADSAWGMGGKATDVSWILGRLGVPTRALGFAAGPNGARMEAMLRQRGVETDFVQVEGETRLNTVVVVPGQGQTTITTSTLRVSPEHIAELWDRFESAFKGASCVVVGGSLPMGVPAEFYAEAIARARRDGLAVLFDSSGPSLRAGVRSHPDLIKPNLAELEELTGSRPASSEEALQAVHSLHEDIGSRVILTLGERGAVAVGGADAYFVHPLDGPVVSAAGAGDGVLAGMALARARHESFEYGLRHGFALAGAILRTLGTADFRVEDYEGLLPQIRIEALGMNGSRGFRPNPGSSVA